MEEVRIITNKEGVNLTNSGYTADDYRVRNDVLEAGGTNATALLSAEKKVYLDLFMIQVGIGMVFQTNLMQDGIIWVKTELLIP